jgi:hypothetical protein
MSSVLGGVELTPTHLVTKVVGVVDAYSWSGCGEFKVWPGAATALVVFDHRDHIHTERGWRNHQLTGGSCFLPLPLAVEPQLLALALNTAAASTNPPAAAANVINDQLSRFNSPPNRLAQAAVAAVAAILTILNVGAAAIGVIALFCWSLTRLAPVTSTAQGVHIASRQVPMRRFAPYMLAFAISSLAVGLVRSVLG